MIRTAWLHPRAQPGGRKGAWGVILGLFRCPCRPSGKLFGRCASGDRLYTQIRRIPGKGGDFVDDFNPH